MKVKLKYRYKLSLKNIKSGRIVRYDNIISWRRDDEYTKSYVLNFNDHRRYYQLNEWIIVYAELRKIYEIDEILGK